MVDDGLGGRLRLSCYRSGEEGGRGGVRVLKGGHEG